MRAAREGWAERKQGYGWRLLPVAQTPESFEQIYRFRMIIEPAGMLEPGFNPDPVTLSELRRVQERMLECDIDRLPAERLLENGATFHEELLRLSGNPFLHMSLVQVNRMRRLLELRLRRTPRYFSLDRMEARENAWRNSSRSPSTILVVVRGRTRS